MESWGTGKKKNSDDRSTKEQEKEINKRTKGMGSRPKYYGIVKEEVLKEEVIDDQKVHKLQT